jgi:hypothetical protein
MIGLYIFGVLVLTGFVALIVVKVRWSRQASHNLATIDAGDNVPK